MYNHHSLVTGQSHESSDLQASWERKPTLSRPATNVNSFGMQMICLLDGRSKL